MTAKYCDKLHQYPPNKEELNVTFFSMQFLEPSAYKLPDIFYTRMGKDNVEVKRLSTVRQVPSMVCKFRIDFLNFLTHVSKPLISIVIIKGMTAKTT